VKREVNGCRATQVMGLLRVIVAQLRTSLSITSDHLGFMRIINE
jgi:hypothetical protein